MRAPSLPGIANAAGETVTVSVSAIRFSFSAENTTYAVINFVSDAGSKRAAGSNAASRAPLVPSTRIQARAANIGAGCAATCDVVPNNDATKRKTARRKMSHEYRVSMEQ